MGRTTIYKQCQLEADEGQLRYQCWLPLKYAVKGKKVRITQYPHTLWDVAEVYVMIMQEEQLKFLGESHRYHRQVTDI